MADIRDRILQNPATIRRPDPSPSTSTSLKFALRRLVVATSDSPLRTLYAAIYRAHIWYAVRTLSRAPGVTAIYVARGAASEEVVFGVSDIDLLIFGEWTDTQQKHLTDVLQRLLSRSPLYDRTALNNIHSIETLKSLHQSDYFFQSRFDQARRHSRLVYGTDVLSTLPPVPEEKARGGYLMELKLWWMMFMTSAFASGPTASDLIFRNSIAFKAVADTISMQDAFETLAVETSRRKAIDGAISRSDGADRIVLEKLARCRARRFLSYAGDIQNDAFHLLLRRIGTINRQLPGHPPFTPLPDVQLEIDAPASEVHQTQPIQTQVARVIMHVRDNWPGYRGASLLPRSSFAGVDDLQLMIHVDPDCPPRAEQVRALCRLQAETELRQRLALYLLLPDGAYLLERKSQLEFWYLLLAPASNPEVFSMLSSPEYTIDGHPGTIAHAPWTRFASDQIDHELALRKTAMAKATGYVPGDPLHLLRGLWRQLQLEVIQRSFTTPTVRFPLTVPAICRGIQAWGVPDLPILGELQEAYKLELEGRLSNAQKLVAEAIVLFARLEKLLAGTH